MRIGLLFLLLAIALLGMAFAVENPQIVEFGYLGRTAEVPLALLLVSAVVGGAALGVVACASAVLGAQASRRALVRELRARGSAMPHGEAVDRGGPRPEPAEGAGIPRPTPTAEAPR